MYLKFSPQRREEPLELSRTGDVLTINGTVFDFSDVADDEIRPSAAYESDWITQDVTRLNGVLHLTLILAHGSNAPQTTLFPEPITLSEDGPVTLPEYDIVIEEEILI